MNAIQDVYKDRMRQGYKYRTVSEWIFLDYELSSVSDYEMHMWDVSVMETINFPT